MPRSRSVVFLHGWTMRGSIFNDLIAGLPPAFECFAPDLPGHGELVAVEPSLGTAAQILHNLLTNHGLTDAVLVGWSMGAAVAWQYIEQFGSDRISGLMTVDMSPKLACTRDWPHGLNHQSENDLKVTTKRMIGDWPGMAQAVATTMFGQRDGAPNYSRQNALCQILTNEPANMIAMWKSLVGMDKRNLIGDLPCPLLATCGARSRVYPESAAQWLAQTAPRGTMHRFENSGHSPHLEEPDAFAKTFVAFASSL